MIAPRTLVWHGVVPTKLAVGADRVFALGVQPFIAGDLFKIAVAAALPLVWRVRRR